MDKKENSSARLADGETGETKGRNSAESVARASRRARLESMRVNAEFAAIEQDIDD